MMEVRITIATDEWEGSEIVVETRPIPTLTISDATVLAKWLIAHVSDELRYLGITDDRR